MTTDDHSASSGEDLDFVMEAAGGGDLDEAQVDRLMQVSAPPSPAEPARIAL